MYNIYTVHYKYDIYIYIYIYIYNNTLKYIAYLLYNILLKEI